MRAIEAQTARGQEKSVETNKGISYKTKQLEKDLRSLSKKLASIEEEIENLEAQLKEWDRKLEDSVLIWIDERPEFYPKYEKQKEELSSKIDLWESIQLDKDGLEQQLHS